MLYIANATKQKRIFCFRTPEVKKVQRLEIESGHQMALGSQWSKEEMQGVIDQLDQLGAQQVSDIKVSKLKKFHGLIYSTSDPINTEVIEVAHEAVLDHQHLRAVQEVEKGAAALDLTLRDKRTGKRSAQTVSVTIKQDVPRSQKPSKNDINSIITIAEDGEDLRLND